MKIKTAIVSVLLVPFACDPIKTPDRRDCTVNPEAFFTTTNQLEFELNLDEDELSLASFTLRNDACRNVRFNYLTDVLGPDSQAFHVHPPPEGYQPWIAPRDSVEVTVEFSPEEDGNYNQAWIQIEYSYPNTENASDIGSMDRILLSGVAYSGSTAED